MTETKVTVRLGKSADREQLRMLAKMLWADNGIVDYDEDLLEQMLSNAFNPERASFFGVIGPEGGTIEGMVYLTMSSFPWTRKTHLEEVMSFVHPDYRTPDRINALISFSKRCVDGTDVPLIMGLFTNIRLAGKVQVYRKHFGYPAGATFAYNTKFQSEVLGKAFWGDERTRGRGKRGAAAANGAANSQ